MRLAVSGNGGGKEMTGAIGYTESYRNWQDAMTRDDGSKSGSGIAERWRAYSLTGRRPSQIRFAPKPRDVMVQCPGCKTVETLQFDQDVLTPSRKFKQRDGKVFHDCGCVAPCHLHR
jgi:hypothetical protein